MMFKSLLQVRVRSCIALDSYRYVTNEYNNPRDLMNAVKLYICPNVPSQTDSKEKPKNMQYF